MRLIALSLATVFSVGPVLMAGSAIAADNPFVGAWELTLPKNAAGWLGVEETNGRIKANLLWAVGSVEPAASAELKDGRLILGRIHQVERTDALGKKVKVTLKETIVGEANGDMLKLTSTRQHEDGKEDETIEVTGRRQPSLPPAPNLRKVKFGKPEHLFNGKDLIGWRLTDPNAISGWAAKDHLLVNDIRQEEGKPHENYGNLRTDKEFEDFNLKLEARLAKGGNSGVYLRGIYEVQVADTYGKPLDSHNMGAIYSRIKPSVSAEKPAGEWQSLDITFVDRHVTVLLNGKRIIDNQGIAGCTGGALWSDVTRPGPIYLQGDHTGIEYRNIVLRPIIK